MQIAAKMAAWNFIRKKNKHRKEWSFKNRSVVMFFSEAQKQWQIE